MTLSRWYEYTPIEIDLDDYGPVTPKPKIVLGSTEHSKNQNGVLAWYRSLVVRFPWHKYVNARALLRDVQDEKIYRIRRKYFDEELDHAEKVLTRLLSLYDNSSNNQRKE